MIESTSWIASTSVSHRAKRTSGASGQLRGHEIPVPEDHRGPDAPERGAERDELDEQKSAAPSRARAGAPPGSRRSTSSPASRRAPARAIGTARPSALDRHAVRRCAGRTPGRGARRVESSPGRWSRRPRISRWQATVRRPGQRREDRRADRGEGEVAARRVGEEPPRDDGQERADGEGRQHRPVDEAPGSRRAARRASSESSRRPRAQREGPGAPGTEPLVMTAAAPATSGTCRGSRFPR